MFLGPTIQGNRVIGATDEAQGVLTINPKTLELDEKGIRIRPEHLGDMLREIAGIRDSPMAKQFPMDVPEKERLRALWDRKKGG